MGHQTKIWSCGYLYERLRVYQVGAINSVTRSALHYVIVLYEMRKLTFLLLPFLVLFSTIGNCKELVLIYTISEVTSWSDFGETLEFPQTWDRLIIPQNITGEDRRTLLNEVSSSVSTERISVAKVGSYVIASVKLNIADSSELAKLDLKTIFRTSYRERSLAQRKKDAETVLRYYEQQIEETTKKILSMETSYV